MDQHFYQLLILEFSISQVPYYPIRTLFQNLQNLFSNVFRLFFIFAQLFPTNLLTPTFVFVNLQYVQHSFSYNLHLIYFEQFYCIVVILFHLQNHQVEVGLDPQFNNIQNQGQIQFTQLIYQLFLLILSYNKRITFMPKKRDKQKEIQERRQQKKKDQQLKKQIRKKMYSRTDNFKLSKEYIQQYTLFDKEIAMLKIKLRDVGGDGNCLFRAFADQIDGDELAHGFMRSQACNHIMKNADFFRPFLDEDQEGTLDQYIKQMRKNGQWGGHFQLQALSECFRCIIIIHKRHLEEVIIRPILNAPQGGIVHLAYFQTEDFEHYLSIRDIEDDSQRPAAQKLRPLNKNLYEKHLYQDQEQYMMIKQIQQLEMIEKAQQQMGQNNYYEQAYKVENEEPYPNYPRNKKCKCGSKLPYKNCCFKQYQKKLGKQIC